MKDAYEVNPYTMAFIGERTESGSFQTRVLETEAEFLVRQKPLTIVDTSCKYFGSSLRGRIEGTREIAGITHKPPIAIDPTNGIYMFPTHSPNRSLCAWISHSYVAHFCSYGNDRTMITFKNSTSAIINVSKGSFENQLNRTAQFRYLLSARIHQSKI